MSPCIINILDLPISLLQIGAGEIYNPSHKFCLDQNDHMEFMNQPVFVTPCSNQAGNQYWWYNENRYLMRDYLCVGVLPDFEQVRF